MQRGLLEATPLTQLLPLENKTAIDISDQILKKVLGKLKIEQQLLNKIEEQEVKWEPDDDSNTKGFEFVIERQKRKVKLEIM